LLDALPLRPGASGEAVRDLQQRLGRAGHACDGDDAGRYGGATEAAVRAFQDRRGLRADGVCGDQTWTSLVEAGYRLGDRLLSLRSPMLRGDDVAELQQLLGALGFDAGRVDGILGPDTAAATTDFQRNAGLIPDGICGPDTIAGLRLFASRLEADGPAATLAHVREVESLRSAPTRLEGRRIAIGHGAGAAALAAAVGRSLTGSGAVLALLTDPDDEAQAAAANEFGAELYLGLVVRGEAGATAAFYERDDYSSAGGRRLAELVLQELDAAGSPTSGPRGMRLPVLRATRMPAVVVEIGDPTTVVARLADVAAAVAAGVNAWAHQPV
jgi:N-acetylmuramoyl-L-alanine amidase